MAHDIKKLFEQERNRSQPDLPKGHEDRFLQKLEDQLPQKKKRGVLLMLLKTSAACFLFICIGWGSYYTWKSAQVNPEIVDHSTPLNTSPTQEKTNLTLSDISPDLKKVETYFISSINVELANLKVTEEEQEIVNAYLTKIKELGKEYDNLNKELNTIGVNDNTITALIENLKIRLQLLKRLKKNLNHSQKEYHDKDSVNNI